MMTKLSACLSLASALAVLAAAPCRAASAPPPQAAPAAAPVKAAAPEVKVSTAPPLTAAQIYTGDRLRDPFSQAGASGGGGGRAFSLETDFNIHNLSLRGVMKDPSADYALFTDPSFGVAFILRNGKLYDSRNKPVTGVTGRLRTKQKWAQLETAEHDVQIFHLGEEEKD